MTPVLHAGLNLGSQATSAPVLSQYQLKVLRIVALSCASTSLIYGIVVLYWFLRMKKRNFRHQLILLLICSDTVKALWQFVFPIVLLDNIGIKTGSHFCTASGWLLAASIEASDYAILMIAIHSVLSIFSPKASKPGKGGLYRYRKVVYFFWVCIPVLLASLAFLNKQPAYTAQGTFCYLPVRPFWFRLALAWIPRYFIMFTITVLYISIYIYVKWTFRQYRNNFGNSTVEFADSEISSPGQTRRGSHHSILGSMLRAGAKEKTLQSSPERRPSKISETFLAIGHQFMIHEPRNSNNTINEETVNQETKPVLSEIQSPPAAHLTTGDATVGSEANNTEDDRRFTGSTLTGDGPRRPSEDNAISQELRRRHQRIQRQLRFLFIYPLVYLLTWLIPLVNNGMNFSESYAQNPSFPLQILIGIAIPIQGTIDCLFFTLRERPWRYTPKSLKQPWWSKLLGQKWDIKQRESVQIQSMSVEARRAYERREQEMREYERTRRERQDSKKIKKVSRKNSMAWWDRIDDGASTLGRKTSLSRVASADPGPAGRSMSPRSATSLSNGDKSGSKNFLSAAMMLRPKIKSKSSHSRSSITKVDEDAQGVDHQPPSSINASPLTRSPAAVSPLTQPNDFFTVPASGTVPASQFVDTPASPRVTFHP